MSKLFKVALIGRPNVGKSTIFNRLVRKKSAITDDMPGVTRDRIEHDAYISDFKYILIDTAGLDLVIGDILSQKIQDQTLKALEDADLVFFIVDGVEGLANDDRNLAKILRKANKKIYLLANKSENFNKVQDRLVEFTRLGFGEAFPISAEHGNNFSAIYETIYQTAMEMGFPDKQEREENDNVHIAIVGRPNAGKSTLINSLLEENRLITGPEAGITRDTIALDLVYRNNTIKIYDTAGIRKRKNIDEKIENMSVSESFKAINFSHVTILLIDATCPLEKQDLTILEYAVKEGRAVIIAVNKCDLIKDLRKYKEDILEQVKYLADQIFGVRVVFISGLNSYKIHDLLDESLKIFKVWNTKLTTGKLNNWIAKAQEAHLIPLTSRTKRRPKLKYITQTGVRPPRFMVFSNMPDEIDNNYVRYLTNSLREEFDLYGIPLRFKLAKTDNPYKK